ncbi:hypothetical protein B0I35DRAFT_34701 [Stachybotrys elegans]|uniref:Uncharacterized protein n=1 Tax=Stachybotrys elegans TaxID=80388 RepID=A0A8K0T6K7_9HYPO|nr:hypothetical protein B0I35DRAFT_34701 [Stachybotrys elegans]
MSLIESEDAPAMDDAVPQNLSVGPVHVQTATDRFGPDARTVISDRERVIMGIIPDTWDTSDAWPADQTSDEEPNVIPSLHRIIPSIQEYRNNLTALSQAYNLYFAAYQGHIYVYRPRDVLSQAIPRLPDLQLLPKQTANSRYVGGTMDMNNPHTINHIITGYLGRQEIVLACFDDGDVVAYWMDGIAHAVSAILDKPTSADRRRAAPQKPSSLRPFLHENVSSSAWGLAIHRKSRLIAVSSNRHEVTVFAPALERGPGRGSSGDACECNNCCSQQGDRARLRLRSWRILLKFGPLANNMPNIGFMDNQDGDAERLCAVDVEGTLWVAEIWNDSKPVVRFPGLWGKISEEAMREIARGWGVLPLPSSSFMQVENVEEMVGMMPTNNEIIPSKIIGDPVMLDIQSPLRKQHDNPCPPVIRIPMEARLAEQLKRGETRYPMVSLEEREEAALAVYYDIPKSDPGLDRLQHGVAVFAREEAPQNKSSTAPGEMMDSLEAQQAGGQGDYTMLTTKTRELDEGQADDDDNDDDSETEAEVESEGESNEEGGSPGTGQAHENEVPASVNISALAYFVAPEPLPPGELYHLDMSGWGSDEEQTEPPDHNWGSSNIDTPEPGNAAEHGDPASSSAPTSSSITWHFGEPETGTENGTSPSDTGEVEQVGEDEGSEDSDTSGFESPAALEGAPWDWGTSDDLPSSGISSGGILERIERMDVTMIRHSWAYKWGGPKSCKKRRTRGSSPAESVEGQVQHEMLYIPHIGLCFALPDDQELRAMFSTTIEQKRATVVGPCCIKDPWMERYHILRAYEQDVELLSLRVKPDSPYWEMGMVCQDVISNRRYQDSWQRTLFHATNRLSMIAHIPELFLVVLGSPKGRVLLVTPTKLKRPELLPLGLCAHGFRTEMVLPRASEEEVHRTSARPLHGLAVSPVQRAEKTGKRGRMLDACLAPKRFRLMLHYRNHDIFTYELERDAGTGKLCIF